MKKLKINILFEKLYNWSNWGNLSRLSSLSGLSGLSGLSRWISATEAA